MAHGLPDQSESSPVGATPEKLPGIPDVRNLLRKSPGSRASCGTKVETVKVFKFTQ